MKTNENIEVRSNLELTLRERGKIKTRRKGHNIFLNVGRIWLPRLVSLDTRTLVSGAPAPASSPSTPSAPGFPDDSRRVRYMGLGIGGVRQIALGTANSAPLGGGFNAGQYTGTNLQTDTDPLVTQLERPVRLSSVGAPVHPFVVTDVFLGQVGGPPFYPTSTSTTFSRIFTESEISYGPFLTVPLSEVGLFLDSAVATYINTPNNPCIAMDCFDTLSKTAAFSLEVAWSFRF